MKRGDPILFLLRHRITGVLGVLFILSFFIAGCGPLETAQDTEVPAAVHMGNEILLWGPEIKQEALNMIGHSKTFCHVTMYELGDPDILQALANAQQRGVDVKVILDAKEPHSAGTAVPYLRQHGINVRLLQIPGGISHIKSVVTIDSSGMHALLGGMNFGEYSWQNHDASVYFAHAGTGFEGLFEEDYARAGGMPEPFVRFPSPLLYDNEIEPAMLQAINRAQQSIVIEAFAFTSKDLISALEAAKARGVAVKVLLDARQYYNKKTAKSLQNGGIDVRFYMPYQGEYLHAKIICIDHGQELFIGSANFSYHGFSVNHEGDVELLHAILFATSIEQDATRQFERGTDLGSTT